MCLFVSVPLLPTVERFGANVAIPFFRLDNGCCDGTLYTSRGVLRKDRLRLGADEILIAGPLFNRLSERINYPVMHNKEFNPRGGTPSGSRPDRSNL